MGKTWAQAIALSIVFGLLMMLYGSGWVGDIFQYVGKILGTPMVDDYTRYTSVTG